MLEKSLKLEKCNGGKKKVSKDEERTHSRKYVSRALQNFLRRIGKPGREREGGGDHRS